ncbi:MAG TPA: POTRA domain-containing protein [Terriglobales bacterium]|nr:POTRA domain-containing protein [Terriglobales bacterium]
MFIRNSVLSITLVGLLAVCSAGSDGTSAKGSPVISQAQVQQSNEPQEQSGEASYQGQTIKSIQFPGVEEATERDRLLKLIPQKVGAGLDRDLVRECMKKLYATGRFADIRAEVAASGDGVVLSFTTTPNFFIGQVTAEGGLGQPSAAQIANSAKLQLGEIFTADKLKLGVQNIELLMQTNGYYQSSVSAQETKHPNTQQIDVAFHVKPGAQARIGTFTITGDSKYSAVQIEDMAGLHPHDVLSSMRITAALEKIRKKYQKQNHWLIQVAVSTKTYDPTTNRVDLTLDIQSGPIVQIEVEGFKIRRSVLKKLIPVYEENALDEDLLNEGRRNLLNYLQTRGYFDASVDLQTHGAHREIMHVVYDVDPKARHKLASISMTGNHYFSDDAIRPLLQIQTAGRVLSHGRFSGSLLLADVASIEALYKNNGFEKVKVGDQVNDNFKGVQNQLQVTFQIEEGPQILVSERKFVGNDAVAADKFPPLNTAAGQPYSEANIAADRQILLNYYFNLGFPDARLEASASPAADNPNRRSVTFTIQEGTQQSVARVLVGGLNYTKPFVVQRELQIDHGDPLSPIAMLQTQQSLYNLGLFSQVDTAVQNPTGSENEKNVLVQVQEAQRYTFYYGLGFEFQTGQPSGGAQGKTGVSPRVSFEVSRLNFRGRDQTITFKTALGNLEQLALVNADLPRWFDNPDWKFSVTGLYDKTVEVSTFASQRLEGSLQSVETLNPASTLVYSFTFRRVRSSDIQLNPAEVPLLSFPVLVGMPEISYIRDTRDDKLGATRGTYTSLIGGVAASYFGSQTDFSQLEVQNSSYYAWGRNPATDRKYVFARTTLVGLEDPFGDTINLQPGVVPPAGSSLIPLPERLLMGGGNSHRGFGLNQAGPRDPQTGFPLGGSALVLNSFELRLPPVSLPYLQDNVSFAFFHDAGNVFTSGNDMLHSLKRWSQPGAGVCADPVRGQSCNYNYISQAVGLGVRYKTPIGPIRFDFAYNLNPPKFPSCQPTKDATVPSSYCPFDPSSTNPADKTVFSPQQVRHFNVFFSIGQTF